MCSIYSKDFLDGYTVYNGRILSKYIGFYIKVNYSKIEPKTKMEGGRMVLFR
jgi:hypothetical protein